MTTNTPQSYGGIARTLHWLTALLILTAIPLGLYANGLPFDTSDALAAKARVFSLHKTLGVAAFAVALVRILWALGQTRPTPLHADRPWETRLAELVHWLLYISLLAVPLSGWVHHAATDGFAPIIWPFGQDLPFVPTSETVAHTAGAMHWLFTKVLVVSILLHIAGALKHAVIDRDATLSRMTRGTRAGSDAAHPRAPMFAALVLYLAGAALAWSMAAPQSQATETAPTATAAAPAPAPATAGNWQVRDGSLGISVRQMGADVQGSFAKWTADIRFDEVATDGKHGTVTVQIDTASLTLGSVSDQATGPDFLDVITTPSAVFTADILPAAAGYTATGTLSLRGQTKPLTLPFTLEIAGDTATMTGQTTLDRRDFGIGASYGDESQVGFAVPVTITLTATRSK